MYYESGMFPILFAAETATASQATPPTENGGELPPPPDDPPKA